MELELFSFTQDQRWTPVLKPEADSQQTLVLVFASPAFSSQLNAFSELKQAYPNSHIVGCSTAGEIFESEIRDDSISVAVMRFKSTKLKNIGYCIKGVDKSFDAGKQLAEALSDEALKGILILSDGMNVNGSELVKGLNSVLPDTVVVTGGLAGDGDRFKETWVLKDGEPQSGYISAVGYYGDTVNIMHGSQGGWDSFGPKRLITKSTSNVLYEIDNKPALALYKDYLGKRSVGLPATALLFPLALYANETTSDYVVRTILSVDEDKQSMTFVGDIPEGYQVQLMRCDFESLIDGAYGAASMIQQDVEVNGDMLNIAISCVGRRLVLGERCEEEIEATLDILPKGTRQLGFYSYGEISPYVDGEKCQLHNQTMTLTTISEIEG